MKKNALFNAVKAVALLLFLVIALFPVYWMVITSFKPVQDSVSVPIQYWPKNFTFQNYADVWRLTEFPSFFGNSLLVSCITGGATVLLSIFAGYGIARFQFRGKSIAMLTFLVTQMVPVLVLIVPLFMALSKLSLIDTRLSLIIPYIVMAVPFCTLMMVGFFKQVPYSIEEAAMIDGCTRLKSLFRVVTPIMLPGIISTFVFAFISAWNELFFSIMFINTETLKTIPSGISMFIQKVDVNWAMMTAAATIAIIPVVILFFMIQKYLVEGLSSGAVKG